MEASQDNVARIREAIRSRLFDRIYSLPQKQQDRLATAAHRANRATRQFDNFVREHSAKGKTHAIAQFRSYIKRKARDVSSRPTSPRRNKLSNKRRWLNKRRK